jgi:coenzyme F420-reducing hydrogenase alpha subunit
MRKQVPKIEGHALFYLHLQRGEIKDARIVGLNGERFTEGLVRGRNYEDAPIITSRICGICPTIHNLTSIRAIEEAMEVKVSAQTETFRRMMLMGQMIQSHALHLYLLVLPDYLGVDNAFELQKEHPEHWRIAVNLKKIGDKIIEVFAGRATHPISSIVGGFSKIPETEQLVELVDLVKKAKDDAKILLRLFAGLDFPRLSRPANYLALSKTTGYEIYKARIKSTRGHSFSASEHKQFVKEIIRPYTKTKFGVFEGREFMVGAIARINLNHLKLQPEVKAEVKALGIRLPFTSPFDNVVAQAIETYDFCAQAEITLDKLLETGVKADYPDVKIKPGIGVGACEAPRGTLYHQYEIDINGKIVDCDIVTPTVQNLPSLEKDMKEYFPQIKDLTEEEQIRKIEMLVRAYDPCITCATQ